MRWFRKHHPKLRGDRGNGGRYKLPISVFLEAVACYAVRLVRFVKTSLITVYCIRRLVREGLLLTCALLMTSLHSGGCARLEAYADRFVLPWTCWVLRMHACGRLQAPPVRHQRRSAGVLSLCASLCVCMCVRMCACVRECVRTCSRGMQPLCAELRAVFTMNRCCRIARDCLLAQNATFLVLIYWIGSANAWSYCDARVAGCDVHGAGAAIGMTMGAWINPCLLGLT